MRHIIMVYMVQALVCCNMQAQSLREKTAIAKLEIIKATIEFLATDTAKFKEVKNRICENCNRIEQLVAFAKTNKITMGPELIEQWKNYRIDTTDGKAHQALVDFKDKVLADISGGTKAKRQQMPGFDKYKVSLQDKINKQVPPPATAGTQSEIEEEDKLATTNPSVTDHPGKKSTNPAKVNSKMVPANIEPEPKPSAFGSALPYIIIALLLVSIYLIVTKYKDKLEKLQFTIKQQQQNISSLKFKMDKEKKGYASELHEAREQIEALQTAALMAEKKKSQQAASQKPLTQQQTTSEINVESPPSSPPPPARQYARYADQGDGFSVEDLLDEEDSETIFEIMQTSANTASYKISANANAQKFALANATFFLNKTCRYDAVPSANSGIITDSPGELKLQGNKWLIVNPAKISFS